VDDLVEDFDDGTTHTIIAVESVKSFEHGGKNLFPLVGRIFSPPGPVGICF
jgi:hypothetical protein